MVTLIDEVSRRRTLAIISHPDAGKTTLTEKLLLYGGALDIAGSVSSKKNQRETASDWMELEKKRGISISSTVLQFDYEGFKFNLLDTPGHKDFSEDTYRVLMAVDAVIMVIDAGKGIEKQTIKLFEICRKRGVPIFTFMNKMDRPSRSPLELIDELEDILGIHAYPVNWPLESGADFRGIYDRLDNKMHLFERVPGGKFKAPETVTKLADSNIDGKTSEKAFKDFVEEVEILDLAHCEFDEEAVRDGEQTPVFFGSAVNNFGVELLLQGFIHYSSPPMPRRTSAGVIPLDHPAFTAFVFKMQTNMNPKHRDCMVFVRVCSGVFKRDVEVYNTRNGKKIRLSNTHQVFGRSREMVEVAYPGDIIGFVTNNEFHIGDTLSTDANICLETIPRFAPEIFANIHNITTSNYKSFRKGLDQLFAENIVQTFKVRNSQAMVIGGVGPLQFEVLQYRLKNEYNVETRLENLDWSVMRWLDEPLSDDIMDETARSGLAHVIDDKDRQAILFKYKGDLAYFQKNNPDVILLDTCLD